MNLTYTSLTWRGWNEEAEEERDQDVRLAHLCLVFLPPLELRELEIIFPSYNNCVRVWDKTILENSNFIPVIHLVIIIIIVVLPCHQFIL